MPQPPRTVIVVCTGINYPGFAGFDVNTSFTLEKEHSPGNYRFVGQPDTNGVWAEVHVAINGQDNYSIDFTLRGNGGGTMGYPFSGSGSSPISNVAGYFPDGTLVPYGGTATITPG